MKFKKLNFGVLKALGVTLLIGFGVSAQAKTSMNTITEELGLTQCKQPLNTIAEQVIGKRSHRLHADQPKRNAHKYPLTVIGVISYNDEEAQVQFSSSPISKKLCEVTSQETFTLPETCTAIREDVFKKWKFIGRLSDKSFFLRNKEDITQNATLTSVDGGRRCLISRRESGL